MTRLRLRPIDPLIPLVVVLLALGLGGTENEAEMPPEQPPTAAPVTISDPFISLPSASLRENSQLSTLNSQPAALPLWREYLSGKRDLRVGLVKGVSKLSLYCEGDFQIFVDGAFLRDGNQGEYITFSGEMKESVTLAAEEGEVWTVRIDGRPFPGRYPGKMEVFYAGGNGETGLTLLNEVSVEEYVAGVAEKEMPSSFSLEALRAQSIAARSYALSYLDRHEDDGFDLCAGTHCQVYRGKPDTFGPAQAAAFSTRRQIIVYEGQPVRTFYHSTCGGATADGLFLAENSTNRAYLCGVLDAKAGAIPSGEKDISRFLSERSSGYCSISPKYRWQVSFTAREVDGFIQANLGQVLGQPWLRPGRVKSLRVGRRHGARAEVLEIDCEYGRYSLQGNTMRWLFHDAGDKFASRLMSTLFSLGVQRDGSGEPTRYVFTGGGWGHGVGMCQWGAEGRARAGASATDILSAYFPGTELWTEKVSEESEDTNE
ncbi:MAG: SpoIID/LytB domain-containing protein [Armatimonadetes bacterium]|nr:SpoIID/LytB domain-containing protein [Armatimonadota bacterium]NIM23600.1 SpoIID/LytB domain-containing protein [Armatimonadota bacterium]NIM67466.1 SpoIID/LytB domain-containing protein [Armatimonadota bacterium]NIM75963.1 SpoIID/LytB domain-containing protein [Armatimonadota bacterium]NIN05652.1 SpoIID/LytB domain-containing protein [Armatimonadota bacterium]